MALSLKRYRMGYNDRCRLYSLLNERSREQRERSKVIEIKKVDYMPENLIIEILSWLPVKDLLKYKSVSKSWYAMISSPDFITKHLKNYYNNNDDWRGCLLVQHYESQAEIILFELFVDETPRVLASEMLFNVPWYPSYVYGPCDGLYFVYYDNKHHALWNPAINHFKPLPSIVGKPGLPSFLTCESDVYGLGLDPVSGDYKVVVIREYKNKYNSDLDVQQPPSVLVYSLRTNSWSYCGDLAKNYHLRNNKCYINVNGCCYWLGIIGSYENDSQVIISFDFATDAYIEINVPDNAEPRSKCLALYDDSLALLSLQENKIFDIWTWNDKGRSWTKKMTSGPFPNIWVPVGHWKDNRLILQGLQPEGGELVLFDPETEKVKGLGFKKRMWCYGVYAYMESLVPIKEKSDGETEQANAEVYSHVSFDQNFSLFD